MADREELPFKIEFTEKGGHRIMLATLFAEHPELAVRAVDRMMEIVALEPDHSVLVVLDVREGTVSDEGSGRWKHHLPFLDRKVRRAAIVCTGLKKLVVTTVILAARMGGLGIADRIRTFSAQAEGIAFLVQ